MQRIIPHLWYDRKGFEAAELYVSLFPDSKITRSSKISDTPSGDTDVVEFKLADIIFAAISAGPYFKLNPSVSLSVACENKEEVDRLYTSLSTGGKDLMPLGEYPFSEYYAWIEDRYGLSWQLMLAKNDENQPKITPVLLFADEACGKAEAAIDYYVTVFKYSEKGFVSKYSDEEDHDKRAKVNYGEAILNDSKFIFMDHGMGGDFTFSEAFSFMILCKDQMEIDYYWNTLSFVPEAEQCGWVKDQFGVSWQIVPENLQDLLSGGSEAAQKRVADAFMQMKKLDIAELEKASLG